MKAGVQRIERIFFAILRIFTQVALSRAADQLRWSNPAARKQDARTPTLSSFLMIETFFAGRRNAMLDLSETLALVDAMGLPLLGLWALLATKLAVGEALRRAEKRFMIALVIITLVTMRTVLRLDEVWIVHTLTLALMVLGVFLVPSREGALAV